MNCPLTFEQFNVAKLTCRLPLWLSCEDIHNDHGQPSETSLSLSTQFPILYSLFF
jgi:hypothetical protein